MSSRHFGHQGRPDLNTKEIVDKLRKHDDISVVFIGKPVDLLVGYRRGNFPIEIKNPNGKDMRGPSWEKQLKFMQEWNGSVTVCKTYEEVLDAIGYEGTRSL